MSLLPVEDALARILEGISAAPAETVCLSKAHGRVLAENIAAGLTQPPWDTSAMDGYAVRAEDVAEVPAELTAIGSAPAGHGFDGVVGPGQTVRIFTGAPLPRGTDTIVIQEDTEAEGDRVIVREAAAAGRYVRRRGQDFSEGDVLLDAGRRLSPRDVALAAAMNHPQLPVRRRPVVAILATGDELVPPGDKPGPDQIIASNGYGVAGLVARAGAEPVDLGVVPDRLPEISAAIRSAVDRPADVLVTLGGASVGEHDLVREALEAEGMALDFWRIAMRPGKPLMFGRLGATRVLGLPGNPVSSIVCTHIFLMPLVRALLGDTARQAPRETAYLARDLPANDRREDYLRAALRRDEGGYLRAEPFSRQDSALLAMLAKADCLVIRPPHAAAASAGDSCQIIRLDV